MRSTVLNRLRRLAVVGAGAGLTTALLAPGAAHATITQPIGPRSDCVTSQGSVILCYTASGTITVNEPTNPTDATFTATLEFTFTCQGVVPCAPINRTVTFPVSRTGVVAGNPTVGLATLFTIPDDLLCVNSTCVPGFDVPITAPTVSGRLASIWVAGQEIPVEVPTEVPVDEIVETVDEAVETVIDIVQDTARKVDVIIEINDPIDS